jgi:hypothetical protein
MLSQRVSKAFVQSANYYCAAGCAASAPLRLLAAALGLPSWRDQQSITDCALHFVLIGVHVLDDCTIKYAVDDAVSVLEGN